MLVHRNALISGASFAGLATAFWMQRLGYAVTIVELATSLKRGGTPVNINGPTLDVARRMGLLGQIEARRIIKETTEFTGPAHVAEVFQGARDGKDEIDYEIERDVLLDMMYVITKDDVEFVFDDSITHLRENEDGISVSFVKGQDRQFDLVFGCDGIHSNVRNLWFGAEDNYAFFLGAYGSVTILDRLLMPEGLSKMFGEEGRFVSLNTYNGKTDIILMFASTQELMFDVRDRVGQKQIVLDRFATMGDRVPDLLHELMQSDNFYFGPLTQIRMPSWTKGRVALVGDAGYCASPAAGKGGSLAVDGAAALAAAFAKHAGDYKAAWASYNADFRGFLEEVQTGAVTFCTDVLGGSNAGVATKGSGSLPSST
jgi:2-polyprenyl-6-methoxyphenol hydroxylase-like FAD-dependent oxidoreductase